MEVSVISTESIKPQQLSAGGDGHRHGFKAFKLCLLDQLMVATHSPLILFYPMNNGHDHHDEKMVGRRLKASLSKTLNPFYHVAGRVKDNLVIDDFDQGVPFTETRVKGCHLSNFLAPPLDGGGPKLEFLNDLLPFEPFCQVVQENGAPSPAQIAVQLNTFDCGGIAIGLNMFHKLMDGVTTSAFLHTWAANCNGTGTDPASSTTALLKKQPELHKASTVFHPRDSIPPECQTSTERMLFHDVHHDGRGRKGASRRFVFDNDAISTIRARARSTKVTNPTRLEALSAFIWESALKAATTATDDHEQLLQCFMQAVNLRPLMSQRLSKHSIGNLITTTLASCKDVNKSMKELVGLLRGRIVGIDDDYIKTISSTEHGYTTMLEGHKVLGEIAGGRGGGQLLSCSSWIGFGFNNFDFGWGKPVWTGLFGDPSGNHPFLRNVIVFKELAPRGYGQNSIGAIEAWIRLDEDVMALLENDPHFIQYASPNPPIILS